MAVDTETVMHMIDEYVRDANKVLPVSRAYLFGSFAKGTSTEYSDVDVCFFSDGLNDSDSVDIVVKLLEVGRRYYPVANFEPHVFSTDDLYSDNPFVKEVLRTGHKLV